MLHFRHIFSSVSFISFILLYQTIDSKRRILLIQVTTKTELSAFCRIFLNFIQVEKVGLTFWPDLGYGENFAFSSFADPTGSGFINHTLESSQKYLLPNPNSSMSFTCQPLLFQLITRDCPPSPPPLTTCQGCVQRCLLLPGPDLEAVVIVRTLPPLSN